MSIPRKHHCIPVFYLKQWIGSDRRSANTSGCPRKSSRVQCFLTGRVGNVTFTGLKDCPRRWHMWSKANSCVWLTQKLITHCKRSSEGPRRLGALKRVALGRASFSPFCSATRKRFSSHQASNAGRMEGRRRELSSEFWQTAPTDRSADVRGVYGSQGARGLARQTRQR